MKRILITGATGNIGSEVVGALQEFNESVEIVVAVRNIEKAKKHFNKAFNLHFRQFDFENEDTFSEAFKNIDLLFLLRPPHISEVDKFFHPLLNSAKANSIKELVFLSVQGAEKSKVIPHNKIERLIRELQFSYIFIRPSYFMQILTTQLLPEIVNEKSISLPAGNAKFNWIDIKNIGEVSALLILDFEKYRNQAFEITGAENKNFSEVADLLSTITGESIRFIKLNLFTFYFKKKNEGLPRDFAIVMTILHFLPRFQDDPIISANYLKLTGRNPTTLEEFITREKEKLTTPL